MRSGLSSAATNLSKKYEEMTANTQAAPLTEAEDDRVSQGSTESRRQSETVTVDGLQQGKTITTVRTEPDTAPLQTPGPP